MEELNCMNCCICDFKENLCHCDGEFYKKFKGVGDSDDFVKKVMTAVQPKRGRWIMKGTAYGCSVCESDAPTPFWNYCPNCGARMEAKDEDI